MHYTTKILSHQGGRHNNQDYADNATTGKYSCWVVADGLGGHAGGEIASRLAVDTVLKAFAEDPGLEEERIAKWLVRAQEAVTLKQSEEPLLSSMRTTLVLLAADDHAARWAHVGDSRLYMFRSGQLVFQTRDHSVSQALADSGQIKPSEIRFHEDRSRLLRTLGNDNDFRPVINNELQEIQADDAFLLCTDGFWEYVLETEMETDWSAAPRPEQWLERMEKRLLSKVDGDNDNYTVLAVLCSQGKTPDKGQSKVKVQEPATTWRLFNK